MINKLSTLRAAFSRMAAPVLLLGMLAPHALAQEIELTAKDNSITLKGELVRAENREITVRTSMGEITVSADEMTCKGACPVFKPPALNLRISGAPTPTQKLLPGLLSAYAGNAGYRDTLGTHPEQGQLVELVDAEDDTVANVQLVSTTSGLGLEELLRGQALIALSTRFPRPTEADAFEERGLGQLQSASREFVLGLESIVILASPQNPISSIAQDDLARIFAGDLTNWSELGGPDAPIRTYRLPDGDPTMQAFEDLILQPANFQMRPDANVAPNASVLDARVAQDPLALGFAPFSAASAGKTLAVSGTCGLRSAPNEFSIKSEEYPLTRRLTAYVSANVPEQIAGLVDHLKGEIASDVAGAAGFQTQDIISLPLSDNRDRLPSVLLSGVGPDSLSLAQDMVREMADAEQLSVSLRFIPGTNRLDGRTHADLARLAKLLEAPDYAGKRVVLASFTEAAADPAENLPLSRQRAGLIEQELLAIAPDLASKVTLEPIGFGDISPLACGNSVIGQHINSRVEVWIKDQVNTGER